MAEIICVRLNWDNTALELRQARHFYNLHVDPSEEYPFGRKGLVLAQAWKQLATPSVAGLLILDGDVMIDPEDHKVMLQAIHQHPDAVHTAPVRIWPVSTKRNGWTWGHWRTEASMILEEDPEWFSFCYTYLPRRLLEAAMRDGLRKWTYPGVDKCMAESAQRAGIKVLLVKDCHPKHMNY